VSIIKTIWLILLGGITAVCCENQQNRKLENVGRIFFFCNVKVGDEYIVP
jgi:hypothetical protein